MAKSKILKGGEKPSEQMPKNERIHSLARRCKAASKAWSKAAAEREELKRSLLEAMIEEGLERYSFGNVSVDIDTTRKLKIKAGDEDDA